MSSEQRSDAELDETIKHGPSKNRKRVIGAFVATALVVPSAIWANNQTQKTNKLQHELSQAIASNKANKRSLQQLGAITARSSNESVGVVTGSTLRNIPSPQRYRSVPKDYIEESDKATVEVLSRVKGSPDSYEPICTGTKVSSRAKSYILLANHCRKAYENIPAHGGPLPEAVNITELVGNNDFAVAEPSQHYPDDSNWNILATVDNVAVDESGETDWAMMQAASSKAFHKLPSVPLNEVISSTDRKPTPGEDVSLYSLPQSNYFAPVKAKGIYIGTVSGYSIGGISDFEELVAINVAQPTQDACDYGGSGSTARFSNGQVTGPLSFRNNLGYGPGDIFFAPDSAQTSQETRFDIEETTGYNLNDFNTICGYSVPIDVSASYENPSFNSIENLVTVLQSPSDVIYQVGGK